ncbi:Uu.00g075450.m01.CDS01 [Anthostomella pinea]|uniref:Uu.00g075450.m01.CDS01 n=1 Tax=Anthostomella pinea TaxID=933095 RepID=A0AAI8VW94_9PEZI|nr:Uu.00g075450.m01.CDS01 [Anthostomella pinea]
MTTTTTNTADQSGSNFPLAGVANDGWSTEDEATATCFCGAVQLAFPTKAPGLVKSFVCNCSDCHKITASMFASNFTIDNSYLKHVRGQENLSHWGQEKTIASGQTMTNYFCKTCGTLMYRVGARFPGFSILRIGTVDDFYLHETKLRPTVEQFIKNRVSWFSGVEGPGVEKFEEGGF